MKAIWGRPALYHIIEEDGMCVLLEPVDGDEDSRVWVDLGDPDLIIDPTDMQVASVSPCCVGPNKNDTTALSC